MPHHPALHRHLSTQIPLTNLYAHEMKCKRQQDKRKRKKTHWLLINIDPVLTDMISLKKRLISADTDVDADISVVVIIVWFFCSGTNDHFLR